MTALKRIPDAEFEIMKVIWKNTPPITTNMIMEQLGKKWRAQTLISLLSRLVDRDFLSTEKKGKERTYFPLVSKDEYLKYETGNFMEMFHENSFVSLVNTLYEGKKLGEKELEELSEWIKKRGE
ncbi:MAG: BlaI/MecI/CopY family transcriptional regulator [Anaerocolumna sp.]